MEVTAALFLVDAVEDLGLAGLGKRDLEYQRTGAVVQGEGAALAEVVPVDHRLQRRRDRIGRRNIDGQLRRLALVVQAAVQSCRDVQGDARDLEVEIALGQAVGSPQGPTGYN